MLDVRDDVDADRPVDAAVKHNEATGHTVSYSPTVAVCEQCEWRADA